MLPSFRLMAVTFFCGFTAVFAALELAKFLHSNHQAVPVISAQAVAPSQAAIADRDLRRGQASVPVTYDKRFAMVTAEPHSAGPSTVASRLMPAPPVIVLRGEKDTSNQAELKTVTPEDDDVIIVASIKPDTTEATGPRLANNETSVQARPENLSKPTSTVVLNIPMPRPRLASLDLEGVGAKTGLPEVLGLLPRPRLQWNRTPAEPQKQIRFRRPIAPTSPQWEQTREQPFGYFHNTAL
jgi:hypothetical protein